MPLPDLNNMASRICFTIECYLRGRNPIHQILSFYDPMTDQKQRKQGFRWTGVLSRVFMKAFVILMGMSGEVATLLPSALNT